MARRNQVVDLYPFDKEEYQKGIEQAIYEVMETKRILQESMDTLLDKVTNPPQYTMEKLEKLKCWQTKKNRTDIAGITFFIVDWRRRAC